MQQRTSVTGTSPSSSDRGAPGGRSLVGRIRAAVRDAAATVDAQTAGPAATPLPAAPAAASRAAGAKSAGKTVPPKKAAGKKAAAKAAGKKAGTKAAGRKTAGQKAAGKKAAGKKAAGKKADKAPAKKTQAKKAPAKKAAAEKGSAAALASAESTKGTDVGPAVAARRAQTDPASEDAGFFDEYPNFGETSATASDLRRLNWRYRLMIERQRPLLEGQRVLDIASHDGRWSFAALKTGAAHVTGVEFRQHLVDNAGVTFEKYGVSSDQYRFTQGDLFSVLADPKQHGIEVDVVMCLGFLYHTMRYPELLLGIRRLNPKAVILDTAVMPHKGRTVTVFAEGTAKEKNAAPTEQSYGDVMLTGRPTTKALAFMVEAYGFEIVRRINWRQHGPAYPKRQRTTEYSNGKRVTWILKPRTSEPAVTAEADPAPAAAAE